MGALAATNVTITVSSRLLNIGARGLRQNMSIVDIAFGNGVLTYPTGGVPLPDKSQLGYKKEIEFGVVEQPYANGFIYKYDRKNHKLKIFTQGIVTGSTGVSTSEDAQYAENSASASAAGSPQIAGVSADTTYDLGPLIELPAAIAPAAATIRMMFVGE